MLYNFANADRRKINAIQKLVLQLSYAVTVAIYALAHCTYLIVRARRQYLLL